MRLVTSLLFSLCAAVANFPAAAQAVHASSSSPQPGSSQASSYTATVPGQPLVPASTSDPATGQVPGTAMDPTTAATNNLDDTDRQALLAMPQPSILIKDRDFQEISPPLPTSAVSGQAEVIIFFSFTSPACVQALPYLRAWMHSAPPSTHFVWAPAVLADSWGYGARVFFALDAMGAAASDTPLLLQAYANGSLSYGDNRALLTWAKSVGLDSNTFSKDLNAGSVRARTAWVPQVMGIYAVRSVPTIIINGHYRVAYTDNTPPAVVVARARYIVAHVTNAPSTKQ